MQGFRRTERVKPKYSRRLESLQSENAFAPEFPTHDLSSNLEVNRRHLEQIFDHCSDVVFREIQIHGHVKMLLLYIDGLADIDMLDTVVLKPLIFEGMPEGLGKVKRVGQMVQEHLVAIAQTKKVSRLDQVIERVLDANVAFLVAGESHALILDMKSFPKRTVEEPTVEPAIRGPRDAFTESLRINTALLRRKVKTTRLKFEPLVLGNVSRTDIAISYIDTIVNKKVLEEVRTRVNRIKIDAILESGYIEEFIEDAPFSPFPTVQNTERPDVVIASLLEGKVAILVDNTPFALIVPFTFWSALQAAEDSYERFIYTTFIRWMRFILLGIALLLPSGYVALTTFHPQLIPTNLVLTFAAAREPSPFPAVVEALMMEIVFEALREAGIRLPQAVGSAVSIVGALVIGQAAVEAGIVSAPMVIVVATTGVASFTIPRYNFATALRLLRFPLLFLAGALGFFGITIGLLALLIHLVSLRSFGVPYLSPVAPMRPGNLPDALTRAPRWSLHYRPEMLTGTKSERVPPGQRPSPKRGR